MSELALYLFDDARARAWAPFSLTRPVGELLYGTLLQRERASLAWGAPCEGHLTSPELAGFEEPGAASVVGLSDLPEDRPTLLLSSRAVPEGAAPPLDQAATLVMGDTVVGWFLPDGHGAITDEHLLKPSEAEIGERVALTGAALTHPWDLVEGNPERLAADLRQRFADQPIASTPVGLDVLGDGVLSLGENVVIEPHAVFDTSEGDIRLEDGVTVKAFTRLAGPAWIGPGATLLGGSLSRLSVGPGCRVRGEVAASVLLGQTNKAHDGFLGHAYVGRWVNLGAGTTNSNLRNDYGAVRVPSSAGRVDTGLLKLGCLLGDHVKTGIGTMLNTGSVIGAGANLFGGTMPPALVPPFSWGAGSDLSEYRLDKFLEVADRVMARRNEALTDGMRGALCAAWERSRPDRA